jgi:hypothetical protein
MKKTALLILALALSLNGFAQVKIGLRFAPSIAFNGVVSDGIYNDATNGGTGLRFSAGPTADFFFADNYAFSTGLWYTVKRSSLGGIVRMGNSGTTEDLRSLYNLQFIQVPLTVKLFTNEVAPDIRVYFQLGGTMDFKVAEKPQDKASNFLYDQSEAQSNKRVFKPFDVGLYLGAGAEYVLGTNTALFGGLNYNRGLINALTNLDYAGSDINNDLSIRNQLFSLEVGLKF